jgi:DNA-directed RNA polymerase specialized sigma24 family protein
MGSTGKVETRLNKFEAEAMSHLDTLLKASRRILHNPHDAEDVVQDTYMTR